MSTFRQQIRSVGLYLFVLGLMALLLLLLFPDIPRSLAALFGRPAEASLLDPHPFMAVLPYYLWPLGVMVLGAVLFFAGKPRRKDDSETKAGERDSD